MTQDQIDKWVNKVHQGDAEKTLSKMPESSVHMAMTSPPYFGLRDYGVDGQIGLEDNLDEYIQKLVSIGREVREVLRDGGSWWLNLGDSYSQSGRSNHDKSGTAPDGQGHTRGHDAGAFGEKNKMLVPYRVAIALQEDGWVVRNDVTWVKPNPMPSSVKDRLNTTTEQVFHLTPEPDYWYDLDAIREEHAESSMRRLSQNDGNPVNNPNPQGHLDGEQNLNPEDLTHPAGKNPGDVFEVTTKPFPDAHFAVYPPELCEKPIKATAPPKVCAECGTPYKRATIVRKPWELEPKDVERDQLKRAIELAREHDLTQSHYRAIRSVGFQDAGQATEVYDGAGRNAKRVEELAEEAKDALGGYFREFIGDIEYPDGWIQACDCDTDATEPGIVLDPFIGSGTTALVAQDLGRRYIGIDLSEEYVAMSRGRLDDPLENPEYLEDTSIDPGRTMPADEW